MEEEWENKQKYDSGEIFFKLSLFPKMRARCQSLKRKDIKLSTHILNFFPYYPAEWSKKQQKNTWK